VNWQGYPSDEPCRVCGLHNENEIEPRFGYTVCAEHKDTPPVKIPPRIVARKHKK